MSNFFSKFSLKSYFFNKKMKKENTLYFAQNEKVFLQTGNKVDIDFTGLWLDVQKIKKNVSSLDIVSFAHWKCCFLSCRYCNDVKVDEFENIKHYDIMPVFQQLIDEKLVTKKTKIIFQCGDATLHPEFDKFMYFLLNYGFENIEINTSAMRFCHSISDAIIKNVVNLVISLDSGCPYIYEKVKGINKHDIAIQNIKRYLKYEEADKKCVAVKYTLVQGVNDNKKELLDWFMFSRNLGVKKLFFDIDNNWFNTLNYNFPEYLKELVLFMKEMASFNNFEIEFSSSIKEVEHVCL